MDGKIDEIIQTSITQTGGIEDILKATVVQVSQELRHENATLKGELDDLKRKIEWLDGLVKNAEDEKVQALRAQHNVFRDIGGHEFRRILDEHELQQAKDVRELAFLEAHRMLSRSRSAGQVGHRSQQSLPTIPRDSGADTQAWIESVPGPSAFPPAPRNLPVGSQYRKTLSHAQVAALARCDPSEDLTGASSTKMIPNLQQYPPHVSHSQYPVFPAPMRNQSSTLGTSPQQFTPSLSLAAGSQIPLPGISGISPPSRVAGLRNDRQRFNSSFFCQDCGQMFKVKAVGAYELHRTKCKGKQKRAGVEAGDLKASSLARRNTVNNGTHTGRTSGLHSMSSLHASLSKFDIRNTVIPIPPMIFSPLQFPNRTSPPKVQPGTPPSETFGICPKSAAKNPPEP